MDIKGVYITKYKIKNQVSNSKGDRCSLTESLFKRVKNKKDFFGYSEKFITENEIAKDIDCNLAVGLLSKDNLKIIP